MVNSRITSERDYPETMRRTARTVTGLAGTLNQYSAAIRKLTPDGNTATEMARNTRSNPPDE